jgi:predicted ABC-class ATPase
LQPFLIALTLDCVTFIPNGAILPRVSGASDKPLRSADVIPFQSPPSLEKTYQLPNRGLITGMVISSGVTTIVGGGFHGKSTLLRAINLGVWNHIPGDGREFVVTNPTAVGVRSEDGRSVTGVNISPFISNLPGGATTEKWSSDDASGSTSMAAGLIEVQTLYIRC